MNRVFCRQGIHQPSLLLCPLLVLFLGRYVGIIIKDRDLKILRQILQHIAAAGCTAAMQKEPGNPAPALILLYDGFQFFLIISAVHLFLSLKSSCLLNSSDPYCTIKSTQAYSCGKTAACKLSAAPTENPESVCFSPDCAASAAPWPQSGGFFRG